MPEQKLKPKPSIARQEAYLKVLRVIHANPTLSQRELSTELGLSVGKINYCVQALLQLRWIKARKFKNSKKKAAYAYLLTSKGVEQRWELTTAFLKLKQHEFERLKLEIEQLRQEVMEKHEFKRR